MEKTSSNITSKENLNLTIIDSLKRGKTPIQISKELNISLSNLSYYIRRLKQRGIIQKKGYGVWEVKISTDRILELLSNKSIRGHAFIWTVKIPKGIRPIIEKNLERLDYKLIRNKIPRLFIQDHKIWIGKDNIVVFENKSFYAKNSLESRKYAVITLIEVLQALEKELGIRLRPYVFKPVKEHYGMIKNDLARQCNRNHEKILINDNMEGDWLWIDDSESLGELEVSGTKAIVRSKQVQDWWNDNKKHNFEMTASKTLEMINRVTENQLMFNKNFESHIKAINTLSKGVNQLVEITKQLKKENEQLKQRKLWEF